MDHFAGFDRLLRVCLHRTTPLQEQRERRLFRRGGFRRIFEGDLRRGQYTTTRRLLLWRQLRRGGHLAPSSTKVGI
jgi:hypothetical protein